MGFSIKKENNSVKVSFESFKKFKFFGFTFLGEFKFKQTKLP